MHKKMNPTGYSKVKFDDKPAICFVTLRNIKVLFFGDCCIENHHFLVI